MRGVIRVEEALRVILIYAAITWYSCGTTVGFIIKFWFLIYIL